MVTQLLRVFHLSSSGMKIRANVSFSPPIVTFKRISVIETEEFQQRNKLHLVNRKHREHCGTVKMRAVGYYSDITLSQRHR